MYRRPTRLHRRRTIRINLQRWKRKYDDRSRPVLSCNLCNSRLEDQRQRNTRRDNSGRLFDVVNSYWYRFRIARKAEIGEIE